MQKQFLTKTKDCTASYLVSFKNDEEEKKFKEILERDYFPLESCEVPELSTYENGWATAYSIYDMSDKHDFEEIYAEIKNEMNI